MVIGARFLLLTYETKPNISDLLQFVFYLHPESHPLPIITKADFIIYDWLNIFLVN